MDKDLLAKRLAFLWHIREISPQIYIQEGMARERKEIYRAYGQDQEFFEKSQKYFYETHGASYEKIINEGKKVYFDDDWKLKKAGD